MGNWKVCWGKLVCLWFPMLCFFFCEEILDLVLLSNITYLNTIDQIWESWYHWEFEVEKLCLRKYYIGLVVCLVGLRNLNSYMGRIVLLSAEVTNFMWLLFLNEIQGYLEPFGSYNLDIKNLFEPRNFNIYWNQNFCFY